MTVLTLLTELTRLTGVTLLTVLSMRSTRSIRSIAQPVKKPGKERFLSANEKNVFCEKVFRDNLA